MIKKENELISIIVPCYNGSSTIIKCLDSIKRQTYKNIEVLIIDDGSTDESKDIIKNFIYSDNRFSYYYKTNGGLSDARNFGLLKSKGTYVTFIDCDDYVEDTFIQKLYNTIKENNVDISVCAFKRIYPAHITINYIDDEKVLLAIHPAAWNKMYRTSLFKENKIYFPKDLWYEDLATTPKLIIKYKFKVINEPLYNYVQTKNSIMHTFDKRLYQIYDAIDILENYLEKENLFNQKKDIIEFINIYHILIGTIYRAGLNNKFTIDTIKKIVHKVKQKYPNWYNNKYIKNLPFSYRFYLKLLKLKFYLLIKLLIKLFGKNFHL